MRPEQSPRPAQNTFPDRVGAGRYAPSLPGELHLGNPRTAVLTWRFAVGPVDDVVVQRNDGVAA